MSRNKKSFNLLNFALKGTFLVSTHTSPVCLFLIAYTKNLGIEIAMISALMTVKKISRLIFDVPFGILFDKIGARKVFLISRSAKIISFIMLLVSTSKTSLFLAMFFNGISYSSFYGKYNAYVYNVLSQENKSDKFHKIVAIGYFVGDIYIALISIFNIKIIEIYGYNFLFSISIVILFLSSFVIFFMPSNKMPNKKQRSVLKIIKDSKEFIRKNSEIAYFSTISGISNFFGWQAGIMVSIVMLDMGFKPEQTATFGIAAKIMTGMSSAIIYKLKAPFSGNFSIKLTNIFLLIFTIFAFIYQKSFVYITVVYCFFHLFMQVSLEKHLEEKLNPKIRGTITSLCWLICTIISIFITTILSVIKNQSSYKYYIFLIILLMFVVNIFCSFKYLRYIKK